MQKRVVNKKTEIAAMTFFDIRSLQSIILLPLFFSTLPLDFSDYHYILKVFYFTFSQNHFSFSKKSGGKKTPSMVLMLLSRYPPCAAAAHISLSSYKELHPYRSIACFLLSF